MVVTQVAYEVEGWGVGELVVVDERVAWHELPWPRREEPSQTPTHPGFGDFVPEKPSGGGRTFVTEIVKLLQSYFAGEQVPLAEVPVDLDYETTFFGRCAAALRAVPRGEAVSYVIA